MSCMTHRFLPPIFRFVSVCLPVFLILVTLSVSSLAQVAPPNPPKPRPEVQVLLDKGRAAAQAASPARTEEALRLLNEALAKARTLGDKVGEVSVLSSLGGVYSRTGQPQKALQFYQQALTLSRQVGDKAGEASVLGSIGYFYQFFYSRTGQPQKALEYYQKALPLLRQAGDKVGEANTLYNIMDVYRNANQLHKALAFCQEALSSYTQAGDKAIQTQLGGILWNVTSNFSPSQKVVEIWEQALTLNRQTGNKEGQAFALINIGTTYTHLGRPQKTRQYFRQALLVSRQTDDTSVEAQMLEKIINHYIGIGQHQNAAEYLQQAVYLYQQAGDKVGAAQTGTYLGNAFITLSQYQNALLFYQQALSVARQSGDKAREAEELMSIGRVYNATGQHEKSLQLYQQALPLLRESGQMTTEAVVLINIGQSYSALGQPKKALDFSERSLRLSRQIGFKGIEASALRHIATIYNALGQPKKALGFCQQARLLFTQIGHKHAGPFTLNTFGEIYNALDQPKKALDSYKQARLLFRRSGNRAGEANAILGVALVQEKGGHLAEAERSLRDALALLETVREELGGLSEAKVSFLAGTMDTHRNYIHLLLKRGKIAEAFAAVQKTKARALLDLMVSGKVDIHQQINAGEKQREQELRGRADLLNAQMVKEGVQNEVGAKKRFAALKTQLTQAESNLQEFRDTLYARHPDLARKRGAKTATLADAARFLPSDTALLEYVVFRPGLGKHKVDEAAVLFVVTSTAGRAGKHGKASVRTYRLPANEEALTKKATALRFACSDPRKLYKAQAREMLSLLLPPAALRQLAGKKRLVICPDGPLWDVPFAALQDAKGRFLLERHELVYAYSATGAQATLQAKTNGKQNTPAAGTLLALANPDFGNDKLFGDHPAIPGHRPIDVPSRGQLVSRNGSIVSLPGTQREANMLRKRFPGRTTAIYTRGQAQEARMKKDASRYRYLHLASHAFSNDAAPLLSSIVLARPPKGSTDDGFLTAREIFYLDLSGTSMVVLSACNTARGEQQSGEGIVGLTWALFVAGAPTQVLSQWAVDDASTAVLMERFYSGLTQNKRSQGKGEALRSAALSLQKDKKYAHPYYWAPFVLMGDWRK